MIPSVKKKKKEEQKEEEDDEAHLLNSDGESDDANQELDDSKILDIKIASDKVLKIVRDHIIQKNC